MKKIITYSFLFLFLSSLFFGFMSFPVYGAFQYNNIDWDSFATGVTSGTESFYSFDRDYGDDANVAIYSINGSTKSLYFYDNSNLDNPDKTTINLDYDEDTEVSSIGLYFDLYKYYPAINDGDSADLTFKFYEGATKKIEFRYYWYGLALPSEDISVIQWLDPNGTYQNIETSIVDDAQTYYKRHIYVNYSHYGSYGAVFDIEVENISSGSKFNAQYPFAHWQGTFTYFDKIEIIGTGGTYGTNRGDMRNYVGMIDIKQEGYGEQTQNYDVSDWDYIGSLSSCGEFYGYGTSDKILEEYRSVKMTTEIKAIDLHVGSEQFTYDSDVSHYWVSLNGGTLTNPVAFIPYCESYLLRWYYINQSINDEYITLEFYHDREVDGHVWQVAKGNPADSDNDGEIGFRHHNSANKINGVYDGTYLGGRDLAYILYIEKGSIYNPPMQYEDTIDTDKNYYNIFDSVNIFCTVSTLLYVNKLVVENDTMEFYNQSFSSLTKSYNFVPTADGTYEAHIYRNDGFVANCTFTVSDIDSDYFIYTVPNPTLPLETFVVYLRYNFSTNPCSVLLYDYNAINPLKTWLFTDVPCNKTISYSISNKGIYFFDLCYRTYDNYSGYTHNALMRKTHVVKNNLPNTISVTYDNIESGQCNILYGSHNFLGFNVFIRINGENQFNMIENDDFTVNFCPDYGGDYFAELVLILSDETITLANCSFSVSGDFEPEEKSDIENAFEAIPDWAKGIGGCIITVGFTLVPVFLVLQIKKSGSDFTFPPIVYAVFGCVGVTFSWIVGFFGFEIFFFMVFITSLVTVISYVWKERSD